MYRRGQLQVNSLMIVNASAILILLFWYFKSIWSSIYETTTCAAQEHIIEPIDQLSKVHLNEFSTINGRSV